jgi:predicted XRE-type DNA-binding protein
MPTPDPIPPLKEEIARIVVDRLAGWRSQAMAAALIDLDQPRMSDLRNMKLTRFSLEKLVRCASRLGAELHFTVTWDPRKRFLAAGSKTRHY